MIRGLLYRKTHFMQAHYTHGSSVYVCLSVRLSVTLVICAKVAERIELVLKRRLEHMRCYFIPHASPLPSAAISCNVL